MSSEILKCSALELMTLAQLAGAEKPVCKPLAEPMKWEIRMKAVICHHELNFLVPGLTGNAIPKVYNSILEVWENWHEEVKHG